MHGGEPMTTDAAASRRALRRDAWTVEELETLP
jgi:hypothetical protein